MSRSLARLCALMPMLVVCGVAFAGDIAPAPAKSAAAAAPKDVLSTSFPITSSGAYFGIYTAGAAGSAQGANIPGVNAASLTTVQGEIGGIVGYRWGSANANRFIDCELDAGFMNLNGNAAGLSLGGPFAGEAGCRVGAPLSTITSFFPNLGLPSFPSLPVLPPGVTAGAAAGYLGGALRAEDIGVNVGATQSTEFAFSPALWAGLLTPLSNGTAVDLRGEIIWDADKCIGPFACVKMGTRYMAKIGLDF